MADTTEKKTYLINVEDNLETYAQHANDAAMEVARLQVENNNLKQSSTATGAEIEKSNAALRAAQKDYSNAKKSVELATKANQANKGSYDELYRRWQLAQTQLKLMGNGFVTNAKGVRVLSEEYKKQSKIVADAKASLDQFGKGVHDNRLNVGSYGEAIQQAFGGVSPVMGRAAAGVKTLNTAFKAMLANPIVAAVAAIIAVIGTLTAYFKRSEEGQNAFAKVTKVLGSILDNILDVVSAVGKAIFEMVTKPKEAIQALGNLIKTQITNRIEALRDIAGALGKIFTGKFKEGFKELGESSIQLVTGVDNLVGKVAKGVKQFFTEVSDDVRRAKVLADELAQIAKDERRYLVENAQLSAQAAALRAKAEDEKLVNANKSIELYTKSFDLDEKILARELEIAKRKAANAAESAALANSDIDTLNEVAALEADVFKKQQSYDELRRQRTRRLNAIRLEALKQEQEITKARIATYEADNAAQKKANDLTIADTKSTLAEKRTAIEENYLLETNLYKQQAALLVQALDKELELKLVSQADYAVRLEALVSQQYSDLEVMEVEHQQALRKIAYDETKRAEADYAAKVEIMRLQGENDLKVLNEALDAEYQAQLKSVDYEQLTANQKLLIDEKYTKAKHDLSMERLAQLDRERSMAADALGALSEVVGQETAAGKAFAVAQAIINTWVAASQALRDPTMPSTFAKIAAMTAIIGAGLQTVRNILAVDTSGKETGGGAITSAPAIRHITAPAASGASTLTPSQAPAAASVAAMEGGLTAESIATALAALPAPVVTVEDINARAAQKRKVEVIANI